MDEKIAKVYQNLKQEGIDDVRAKDIIQKIEEYYDCLLDFNLEELDYIGALKAIQYGRFLKSNNASGDNAKVWNDAKVYSDDNVVIWKPRNFQEASIIGIPQWCVSAQDYHWNDHINSGDTIYMIYCGWESGNRQFVSACVERNGNIILYESGHDRIEGVPIFANGKLRAAVKQAKADQEEAKIAFRQAILEAGQEVNDILASRQYAQRAIMLNSQQVEKLTDVLASTEKRMHYDSEVNYLQVLLARQSLLEARLSLLSHRYGLLESTIQLYKALGGEIQNAP